MKGNMKKIICDLTFKLDSIYGDYGNSAYTLHCLTGICVVLAKFAYDTLQVFEQREMFVVDSALYSNAVVPQ